MPFTNPLTGKRRCCQQGRHIFWVDAGYLKNVPFVTINLETFKKVKRRRGIVGGWFDG